MLRVTGSDWSRRTEATLGQLDHLVPRINQFRGGFEQGSDAARDATRAGGYYAWSFATAGIQGSFDHLRAWRLLHAAAPQLPFAHWTLLRASVGGSALARWNCNAPVGERAGRGIGAQKGDFQERQGFEGRLRRTMPTIPAPKVFRRPASGGARGRSQRRTYRAKATARPDTAHRAKPSLRPTLLAAARTTRGTTGCSRRACTRSRRSHPALLLASAPEGVVAALATTRRARRTPSLASGAAGPAPTRARRRERPTA